MNIIEVIKSGDYLILDTETTGLGSDAEICQIAIIDAQGNTLLDTLVKPMKPIPAEATRIHGITNEMVEDAPFFNYEQIKAILYDRNVIVYNMDYDMRMLYQSEEAVGSFQVTDWDVVASNWYCAMQAFAEIYGDWNPRYGSYKWKSLDVACTFYGIQNTGAHSALADCQATLAICKAMAASEATK